MKKHTKQISLLIKQAVGSIDPKAQIILYGSRARGTEKKESDWDILILTDYKIKVPKLMFMKIDETMELKLDFYLKEVKDN